MTELEQAALSILLLALCIATLQFVLGFIKRVMLLINSNYSHFIDSEDDEDYSK